MRKFRVALAALTLLSVTTACTSPKEPASFEGGVETTAAGSKTEPSTSTTAVTPAAVVLAPDGLGAVSFGTQAARAMNALTQAFGRAENVTVIPPAANCGATRIFRWKDFAVLINEVSARSGGNPGLVGWSLGPTAPASADLETEKGIGIGSTAAAVKEAYGAATNQAGATLTITAPNGVITAELEAGNDSGRVKTLRAGVSCGA
jgi:hypothetical protein